LIDTDLVDSDTVMAIYPACPEFCQTI